MLGRLFLLLSLTWAALWVLLYSVTEGKDSWVSLLIALAPFVIGPLVKAAYRYVIFGG